VFVCVCVCSSNSAFFFSFFFSCCLVSLFLLLLVVVVVVVVVSPSVRPVVLVLLPARDDTATHFGVTVAAVLSSVACQSGEKEEEEAVLPEP